MDKEMTTARWIIVTVGAVTISISLGIMIGATTTEKRMNRDIDGLRDRLVAVTDKLLESEGASIFRAESREWRGIASWYGPGFHGRQAADQSTFNMNERTLANKVLPFGTMLRIENTENGKWTVGMVTDRGPYKDKREFDVSLRIAQELGMVESGLAVVKVRILE